MEEKHTDYLKDEYLHVQSVIEAFDERMLTIKAWSITVGVAGLGVAFERGSPSILIVTALSGICFWLLEAIWKTFQYAHYERSGQIEAYFAGQEQSIVPMQIGRTWFESWRKGGTKRLIRILFWYHVMLPHALLVVVALTMLAISEVRIIF